MPDFHHSGAPGKKDSNHDDEKAEPRLPPIPLTEETITFRDGSGALWWAHEVDGQAFAAPGRMCLLLISGTKLRRVWTFPPHWRSLTATELLNLPENSDD